jgi:cytoskeletal protein RodZ
MPSVGDQLREGRERRQLSVTEVANATNIKSDYVRAMEEGDWRTFSAPVYIKGFVRTYATHLKLDTAAVVAALEVELSADPELCEPPPLEQRRRGPIDWLMLQASKLRWVLVFPILVGIAVLAAAYFGYQAWQRQQPATPSRSLSPGLRQTQRTAIPATLPVPTNTPPAAPSPSRPRR